MKWKFKIIKTDTGEIISEIPKTRSWNKASELEDELKSLVRKNFGKRDFKGHEIHVYTALEEILFPNGKRVPWTEWHGYIVKVAHGEQQLEWRERDILNPIRLMIHPEIMGCYVFSEYGIPLYPGDAFPYLSTAEEIELESELGKWNDIYSCKAFSTSQNPNFDWQTFHTEGLRIARKIKKMAGKDSVVIYSKAWEDPNRRQDWMILIEWDNCWNCNQGE